MGLDTRKGSTRAIPLIVFLLMSIPMIYADDPTLIDIEWSGDNAGIYYYIVSGNDTWTEFRSVGAYIIGEFHAIDYDDDPGGLGFDTFETKVKANITGGGETELENVVNGTLARSYTKIETDDFGYLGWKTITNSTHLLNFNSDDWVNGFEIQAEGDFNIIHRLLNPENEGVIIRAESNGTATIYINLDKEWVTGTTFESGIFYGCDAWGTGSAEFNLEAYADNYLIGDLGYELPNGGLATFTLEYYDGFSVEDFGSKGD